jgi:hypothetical protein
VRVAAGEGRFEHRRPERIVLELAQPGPAQRRLRADAAGRSVLALEQHGRLAGLRRPARVDSRVDLPAPLRPRMARLAARHAEVEAVDDGLAADF